MKKALELLDDALVLLLIGPAMIVLVAAAIVVTLVRGLKADEYER